MVRTTSSDSNHEDTGKLISLVVRNFKSYRDRKIIGPFSPFTAVVGPNGSGKSNLMDAICFVLGERTQQYLRGTLKELLYTSSQGESEQDGSIHGSVGMRLVGRDGQSQVFFERIIEQRNNEEGNYFSQYRVDEVVVTYEQYNARLMDLGILVKARNFLVPQGQVEQVASKDPKELTGMFEEISGSGGLKQRYEELEQSLAEKRTLHANALKARRHIVTEKNQKKQQKIVAEKHIQIREELELVRTQYYLWKAFKIQEEIEECNGQIVDFEQIVQEFQQEYNGIQQEVVEKQQELNTTKKEKLVLDKQIRRHSAEIDKNSPTLMRIKADIRQLSKRLERQQKELQTKSIRQKQHEEAVQKLQSEFVKVNQDVESLDKEVREQQRQWGAMQLTEEQMTEYEQLKTNVNIQTSAIAQQRDVLQENLTAQQTDLNQVKQFLNQCDEKNESLRKQLERLQQQKEPLAKQIDERNQELQNKQTEREDLVCENRRSSTARQQLQKSVDKYEFQLREVSSKRQQSELEKQKTEAVQKMMERFPGRVYGRMLDLLKIPQKKYNLSISIAIEGNMDAVVVDNNETAKQCINFLKEFGQTNRRFKLVMTFIPLETIKAKDINEQFREIGGTVKLAIDLIEFENHLHRAFLFALGNTLICDTLDEARRLAYSRGNRRVKVVTLDGSKIDKSGTMSGGTDERMLQKAAKLEKTNEKDAREKLQRAQDELSKIGSEREAQQRVQLLTTEIQELQQQIRILEMDVEGIDSRIQQAQQKLTQAMKQKEEQEPRVEVLQNSIQHLHGECEGLANRINEISDEAYAEFSGRVGVPNIRQYEEQRQKIAEQERLRRAELNGVRSTLEQQLQFEMRHDFQEVVRKLQNDVGGTAQQLQELQEQEANMEEVAQGVQGSVEDKQKQVEVLSQKISQMEKDINNTRSKERDVGDELFKAKGRFNSTKAKIQVLQSQMQGVEEEAQMEQIQLPLAVDAMDVDDDGEGTSENGSQQQQQLDFAVLDEKYKRTHQNKNKIDEKFRQDIDKLQKNLDRHKASAHALEQYEAVVEREERQQQELAQIQEEKQKVEDEFNTVKQQRSNLFQEAFEHVKSKIDEVYKDLTRSQYHTMGGSAYLNLEDEDYPFLGGIRFNVMPPSKRFREMELLSGGERTLAALALIFAIHSFRPSPFFVMDEIDASLDQVNVSKIVNYIRSKSSNKQLQCIVISLKDQFYGKADLLVGVYRDLERFCSNVAHFDLSRFPA